MKLKLSAMILSLFVAPAAMGQSRSGGEGHGGPDRLEVQCLQDAKTGRGYTLQIFERFGQRGLTASLYLNNTPTFVKNERVRKVAAQHVGTPVETPQTYTSTNVHAEVWVTGMPLHFGPNERAGQLAILLNGRTKKISVTCFFYR